jgi:murein hydrolase activator
MLYRVNQTAMKRLGFIIIFILIFTGTKAQPLDDLKSRKKKAEEEIEYTSKLIKEAKEGEQSSLNKLRLIENNIYQRNRIISALNSESDLIQQQIDDNTRAVKALEVELANIKNEYADMIRAAFKNKSSDNLILLLSSDDFNQAYKRYLYLKQYSDYRKVQLNTLQSLQSTLEGKVGELKKQKEEKAQLLVAQELEARQLSSEKKQQNQYVQKMQKEQSRLRQKLKEQQKIESDLEKEIQRIVEEEAKKSRVAGKPGFEMTPEQKLISDNFSLNKSRLPWPVERGIITEHFGLHIHPSLKNITIKNNGVDITTEPGSRARAVFSGEVSRVFAITGGNMAVIVRHGQYLTVYSNLKDVTVKQGDIVATKQNIGTVFTDSSEGDKTVLKFQVWNENQKMDPEEWIVK